jgi:hypothetical protein
MIRFGLMGIPRLWPQLREHIGLRVQPLMNKRLMRPESVPRLSRAWDAIIRIVAGWLQRNAESADDSCSPARYH